MTRFLRDSLIYFFTFQIPILPVVLKLLLVADCLVATGASSHVGLLPEFVSASLGWGHAFACVKGSQW